MFTKLRGYGPCRLNPQNKKYLLLTHKILLSQSLCCMLLTTMIMFIIGADNTHISNLVAIPLIHNHLAIAMVNIVTGILAHTLVKTRDITIERPGTHLHHPSGAYLHLTTKLFTLSNLQSLDKSLKGNLFSTVLRIGPCGVLK
jgi:hypothetical protein